MAQIKIRCPHCQSKMECEEEWIGLDVACPNCQKNFVINCAPGSPTLVRDADPPKLKKKIVLLLAGGVVVLLLAAVWISWFAFSGNSSTDKKEDAATLESFKKQGFIFSEDGKTLTKAPENITGCDILPSRCASSLL